MFTAEEGRRRYHRIRKEKNPYGLASKMCSVMRSCHFTMPERTSHFCHASTWGFATKSNSSRPRILLRLVK
ncbi:unnamed protein product [Triticum turgidum subsp. durum]|uniref:Uncharacterized protein n=1 Tax=Triticum turgidum subsp. durum TaxID=4567 RepID=A0A9R1A6S5_TRITD|nr:unnamed protein product [Triticum turgidum subsp. durum]